MLSPLSLVTMKVYFTVRFTDWQGLHVSSWYMLGTGLEPAAALDHRPPIIQSCRRVEPSSRHSSSGPTSPNVTDFNNCKCFKNEHECISLNSHILVFFFLCISCYLSCNCKYIIYWLLFFNKLYLILFFLICIISLHACLCLSMQLSGQQWSGCPPHHLHGLTTWIHLSRIHQMSLLAICVCGRQSINIYLMNLHRFTGHFNTICSSLYSVSWRNETTYFFLSWIFSWGNSSFPLCVVRNDTSSWCSRLRLSLLHSV